MITSLSNIDTIYLTERPDPVITDLYKILAVSDATKTNKKGHPAISKDRETIKNAFSIMEKISPELKKYLKTRVFHSQETAENLTKAILALPDYRQNDPVA